MSSTPSERQHLKINPYPLGTSYQPRNPMLLVLKNLFGTPIPFLLAMYVLSTMTSMSGLEIFGWGVGLLSLCYMIIDQFSTQREIRFFRIGADLWIWLLVITSSLGLLLNSPDVDFWKFYGKMRWAVLLYLLTYSHFLFPGLKKYYRLFVFAGGLVAGYAVIQHFTGVDIRYDLGLRAQSAVGNSPTSDHTTYQVVGLFGHHLTYGYVFSMILCFTTAGLFLLRHIPQVYRILLGISSVLIALSLVWTFGRGVWIASGASLLFMAGFLSRKIFLSSLLALLVLFTGAYNFSSNFQKRVDTVFNPDYRSNNVRNNLWMANIEMFKEHPLVGIGLNQNEARSVEYQEKLGFTRRVIKGHAHNSYIQWLSTTGALGFTFYMLFILTFLLITYKLWAAIPPANSFHRTLVLGALGAQISLHVGGLTQWNFGDAEVNHLFIFILSMISYMNHKYEDASTPDDESL